MLFSFNCQDFMQNSETPPSIYCIISIMCCCPCSDGLIRVVMSEQIYVFMVVISV